MKNNMTILIMLLSFHILSVSAQNNDKFKDQFLNDLQSNNVEDGCKIVVFIVNSAANSACFVPEPTISKVACAAAQIMNASAISNMDPNLPNAINDAGVKICQLTYASLNAGIKYTFEFSKNQTEEIKNTWNWLNSLEGALFFIEYMSYQ